MVEAVPKESQDPSGVSYVLEAIYKQQQELEADSWIVHEVISLLRKKLETFPAPFLASAEYKLVGSAAESLVVSRKDDKDVLLLLGQPYTPKYFQSVYDSHGRHFLKWNKTLIKGTKPRYVGPTDYLSIMALRTFVNGCLQSSLKGERVGNLKVNKLEVWKQAVRIHLKAETGKQTHIIDILPQIRGDQWSKVEGVEPLNRLGPMLRKTVSAVEASGEPSITFSLFGPAGTSPSTVTTCFALVEKEFFTKNKDLRNVALLAKIILTGHNWKNRYGLKIAHFKRLIMAKSEHFSTLSPWQGLRELLHTAKTQLQKGSLDGFPDVKRDLMWHKTDEDCHAAAKDIVKVMMTLDPQYFALYLC